MTKLMLLSGTLLTLGVFRILKSGEFTPLLYRLFKLHPPKPPPIKAKTVAKGYECVRAKFESNFKKGREVGASVVVLGKQGEVLVELYGGYSDLGKGIPYTEDTLQLCYSCSKFLESVVLAKLVELGFLKYTDLISKFWPEFAQNNKQGVTIADLMRHEGGLTYFQEPQPTFDELKDQEKLRLRIEAEPHQFDGTRKRSYHAVTRGLILNEIVTRVHPNKLTLNKIYQEDINRDGVEFYLGLPNTISSTRRSRWYSYPILDTLLTTVLPSWFLNKFGRVKVSTKLVFNPWLPIHRAMKVLPGDGNFTNLAQLQLPSCNGFTNARSLAAVASGLSGYLTPSGLARAVANPVTAFDHALDLPTTFTQAGLGQFTLDELNDDTIKFYGWTGMGGSAVVFNIEHGFAMAYLMNAQHITFLLNGRSRALLVKAFQAHRRVHNF